MMKTNVANPPHGGKLINLFVDENRRAELRAASKHWPSWDLSPRQLCDLELLMNGGYSPLDRFMGQVDYETVCSSMRLKNRALWPLPVVLDVTADFAKKVKSGDSVALR